MEAPRAGVVDRCVCAAVSFARVVELSRGGMGMEEIAAATGCGTGCGLCKRYAAEAIRTGRGWVEVGGLTRPASERGAG